MDLILSVFDRMNMWAWWAIAGLVLIAELLTGTTYLLWPAAAAFLTGFIALETLGLAWPIQVGVFAILSLVLLWAGDRWVKPRLGASSDFGLNDRANRMLGETVTLVSEPVGRRARVRFGDSEWSAELVPGLTATTGDTLQVEGIDGVTLLVGATKADLDPVKPVSGAAAETS